MSALLKMVPVGVPSRVQLAGNGALKLTVPYTRYHAKSAQTTAVQTKCALVPNLVTNKVFATSGHGVTSASSVIAVEQELVPVEVIGIVQLFVAAI